MKNKRIVITGMAINTPIGDTLDEFSKNLLLGKSAISSWTSIQTDRIYGKIGGDLGGYDSQEKFKKLAPKIPVAVAQRLKKLLSKPHWSSQISILMAIEAFLDANFFDEKTDSIATIVAGHNLNLGYTFSNHNQFLEEPDFIDGLFSLYALDTDHVGAITSALSLKGPAYTVGGACASGNFALRCAVDEILHHNQSAALIVAPLLDFSPLEIHGMALMGAITYQSFNETPEKASRPFDKNREGFVPSHGGAALLLEELDQALERGATIYAEVLGVEAVADANRLPQPSQEGQSRLMNILLKQCQVAPEEIDFVSAHATSTPLGDLTEIRSVKEVFGKHANNLKLNAPKSLLGHTCWSSATVETVAALLQMKAGALHPSLNIEELDSEVDLNVCRGEKVKHQINYMLKNSFGFGGLNSISLLKRFESSQN